MSTRPPQRSAPAVASMLVLCGLMAYGGWFWLKTNSVPAVDIVETDNKTVVLSRSTDYEGVVIDASSLHQPANPELNVDNVADTDTAGLSTATSSTQKQQSHRDLASA